MLLIRPVTPQDQPELLALAKQAGTGMTSLPEDAMVLEQKIARAAASFAGLAPTPRSEAFLFVLEDNETGKAVGTCGMAAHVGEQRPFYSYKLSTIVQAAENLGIYTQQKVLHMVNDYTGAAEIGSLFLLPEYRRDGLGRFLSRSRFLMMAEFPELFGDIVIAEIRGVMDEKGESPFYRYLAKWFFQMEYQKADFICATQGGQFITDLMPKYPIYVTLLHPKARAVIGEAFSASQPAKQLLEAEGFRWQGYVDLFDAGPTMQAELKSIRTVRKSRVLALDAVQTLPDTCTKYMIANRRLHDFRMVLCRGLLSDNGISIQPDAAEALRVKAGDTLRVVEA